MMSGVKNSKQVFMPLLWLNCIFCMGVFEIPINRPRYFLSVFYDISIMTGYFIMLYKGIYILQETYVLEFMIFKFVMGFSVLVAVLAVILFWCNFKNMNSIIKRNGIAHNTLEELGIKTDYPKASRRILYQLAMWTGGMITIYIMEFIWTHNNNIGYWLAHYSSICFCFPIILNSVVDLTFASFIRNLRTKFQQINILLNKVVFCANESNAFNIHHLHEDISIAFVMRNYKSDKHKIIHLIQTLRHLHLETTRIGRQINCTYGLQLLLEMAVHFAAVTSTTFCIYSAFSGKLHVTIHNERIISLAIIGGIYLSKNVVINWLCTSVSFEAHKTGTIVESFEGTIIDNDMREEIHQFVQQTMLNPLNFTAAGFFSIDNSLTAKFIATVTTYVVILIQMNALQA